MFYACYRLSLLGWNAMPTSRNAKGIDVICFSMDGTKMKTVQVKSMSTRSPVPLGPTLGKIMGDYWVIVNNAINARRQSFVLESDEVRKLAHRGEKGGRVSYWLQPRAYDVVAFRERWDRIGEGC
ncbi:MAG: hypothetical protein AAF288_05925 [Planctomycetota bacterium]